jgi:hypothetical protein
MGRMLGSVDSAMCQQNINLEYIATLVTQKVWVAPRPCVVVDIRGATRVAGSGGACSIQFFKAASGVAVGSGTLLHAGTFDLVGTADTNQVLTLVPDNAKLTLAAGDSIGYVLTGTATSAVGCVCVTVEPV